MLDRAEDTLRKVREYNRKQAQKMGLPINKWHDLMSTLGNSTEGVTVNETERTSDEIALANARWTGDYYKRILGGLFTRTKD